MPHETDLILFGRLANYRVRDVMAATMFRFTDSAYSKKGQVGFLAWQRAGGNLLGCDPFPAGSLTGKVVLVDRGVCNFSAKIANIAAGDGQIGVIGLVTPGDPFDGSLGDCPGDLCAAIPGYMVSQSVATAMKM